MTDLKVISKLQNITPKIKNVVIFVSDSLRWDHTPEMVADLGMTFKTISSGIFTPPSFASIISGLYPNHHGVHSFSGNKIVDNVDTLFNIGLNYSLYSENTWTGLKGNSPLHKVLNCNRFVSLEDIRPPFIYIEDEKGGHCPYGWSEDDEFEEWDCRSFFRSMGNKDLNELRLRYKKGVTRSVEFFYKRLATLYKRGLEKETLVIFMSDHGELLGEYGGLIGHGNVTVPEVVYVPTILIHPSLPKNIVYNNSGVFRHIDIFPLISDILGIEITNKIQGESILRLNKLPDTGYSFFQRNNRSDKLKMLFDYDIKETGIWDYNGGYIKREGNIIKILGKALIETTLSDKHLISVYKRQKILQNPLRQLTTEIWKSLKPFIQQQKYGDPSDTILDQLITIKE